MKLPLKLSQLDREVKLTFLKMRFNDESETFGEEPGGFSKPVFPTLILEGATSEASKTLILDTLN